MVFLGAGRLVAGDLDGGTILLNEALRGLDGGDGLAEGHLWRGRALLARGNVDGGWWDLDRAGEGSAGVRIAAALERLRWGVALGDGGRAREGIRRLFANPAAGEVGDTMAALVRRAGESWGWAEAARLLEGAASARWDRAARGRIRIERARLLAAAGEPIAARAEASAVASGVGPAAAEARLLLARWHLKGARALVELDEAVRFLLPAEGDPRAAALLQAVQSVSALAEEGLEEPLAWFAAAEMARDRLGAPLLARGLFLAYADAARDEPWSVKALLAALEVSPSEGDRAWLRGRLEGREESPYVLAARGAPAPGFERLEEELARRLDEMRNR